MIEETKTFLGELRLSGCDVTHLSQDKADDGEVYYHYVVYRDSRDLMGVHFMRSLDQYSVFFLKPYSGEKLHDKHFDTFEDMAAYVSGFMSDG